MAKIRRIDFSPDEWLAGTIGLSLDERGLYITACALIYSHVGPIKIADLKAACNTHGARFRHCLDRLVSLGKLVRNGEEIDQRRCEDELEKARNRSENGSENVAKRWKINALDSDSVLLDSNTSGLSTLDGKTSGKRAENDPKTIRNASQTLHKRFANASQNDPKTLAKRSENGAEIGKINGLATDSVLLGSNTRARVPSTINHQPSTTRKKDSSAARVIPLPRALGAHARARGAPTASEKFVFEGFIVRLTEEDLDRWRNSFSAIPDIEAELRTIDDKLHDEGHQGKWFGKVSSWLRTQHETLLAEKKKSERPRFWPPNEGVFGSD